MRASFIGGPRINNLRNSLAGKSNGRKRERERERGRKKEEKKEEKWRSSNFIFYGARLSLVPFYKQSSKHPRGKIPPPCSKLNLPASFSVDLFVNSCHAPPIQIKKQAENSTIRTGQRVL